jgi:hypothetical protein
MAQIPALQNGKVGCSIPRVFARCGKILVVGALVLTTGLHWAALQTVAWSTMLAANLTSESLSASVADTFDGKHLCPLCRAIAAAKSSEKKSDANALKLKLEYPPVAEKFVLIAPASFEPFAPEKFSAGSFSSKPPLPPPRSLFV